MKRNTAYLSIPFGLLLAFLTLLATEKIQQRAEQDITNALSGVIQTAKEAISLWNIDKLAKLQHIARNEVIVNYTEQLLSLPQSTLSSSPVQFQLREEIHHNFHALDMGYFVIAKNRISLASRRDTNIGSINVIERQRPDLLARVFAGESLFIPPIVPDLNAQSIDQKHATAFFAAPIKSISGEVLAVLTMRIDPYLEFSQIIQTARIGLSGETYAFDDEAKLITESRFHDDLVALELIKDEQSSILNVSLILDGELNHMAASAMSVGTGVNVSGYEDYRKIKVVGTWMWLPELNIGLATEIDYAEAFANYKYTKNIIYLLAAILLMMFVISIYLNAKRSKKVRTFLEGEVQARTKELQTEKHNFASLFQNSRDAILLLEKGKVLDANKAAVQLFEFSSIDELIGQNPIELSPSHQVGGQKSSVLGKEYLDNALNDDKSLFEWLHVTNKGKIISCEVWLRPMVWLGKPVIQASVRNISKRKEAERKVLDAQQRQIKLLEATPEPVIVVSEGGLIVQCNKATERTFGYKMAEMLNQSVEMLIPLEFRKGHQQKLDHYMSAPIRKDMESRQDIEAITKDGKRLIVVINLNPIHLEDETLIVAGIRDITQQKIAERGLVEAKKIAVEANQAKSDFLANMSHEIRTPMNAIIGMSHLALQTELKPKQRNFIEKVHRSAEALLGIINDILDFSKIEAGKLDIEQTSFYLEDVMENLANLVGLKAEEKGLELYFDIASDVPTHLLGDPLRLSQVLINLGNNAVKFTSHGGEVVVAITLEKSVDDSAILHFKVKDTGIGMSPEQVSRLFQSFSQADSSTTRKYGGTGLGLTISKRLTELMEGEIWVDSEPNKGSCFHFTAKVGVLEGELKEKKLQEAKIGELKVLVVDDNSTAREILTHILESLGFNVTSANSGEGALQLISEQQSAPFELVIMDWKMPGKDGIQTTLELQANSQIFQQPTVIMVTAYGREDINQEATGIELGGILTKPVTSSSLLDAILLAMGKEIVSGRRNNIGLQQSKQAIKRLQGAKVLLVEDNLLNQELALELLSSNGIIAVVAENGQEALDKLSEEEFDGVLMDCQMPIMDGYTATRKIREQEQYAELPILAMTANAMAGDKDKVLAAGMNDHIAKPINVSDMFNTMAAWITPSEPLEFIENEKPETGQIQFPVFQHINSKAGLATTQNNSALYAKLLKRFVSSYQSHEESFYTELLSEDKEAAARWAHSLKGTAGNIGAQSVQEAAKELEQACKTNTKIKETYKLVEQELNRVLIELEAFVNQPNNVTKQGSNIDMASLRGLLEQLNILIEDYDTEASEVGSQVAQILAGTNYVQPANRLVELLDNYDFEQALEQLAELEKQIS